MADIESESILRINFMADLWWGAALVVGFAAGMFVALIIVIFHALAKEAKSRADLARKKIEDISNRLWDIEMTRPWREPIKKYRSGEESLP